MLLKLCAKVGEQSLFVRYRNRFVTLFDELFNKVLFEDCFALSTHANSYSNIC